MQELKEFLGQALTPDQKRCKEDPEIQTVEEKTLQLNTAIEEAAEGKRSPEKRIKQIIREILINIHAALQSEENINTTTYSRHDMGLHVKRYGFNIEYPRHLDIYKRYAIPGVYTPTKFVDIQRAFREVLLSIGMIENNSQDLGSIKKIFEGRGYRRKVSDKLRVVISKAQNSTTPNEVEATEDTKILKKNIRLNGEIDFDLLRLASLRAGHPNVDMQLKALFQKRDYSKHGGGVVCELRSNSFALLAYHSWHPDREIRKASEYFKMCPGFGRASYEVLEAYLKEIGLI